MHDGCTGDENDDDHDDEDDAFTSLTTHGCGSINMLPTLHRATLAESNKLTQENTSSCR